MKTSYSNVELDEQSRNNEEFKKEIIYAKEVIDKVGRCSFDGYRSACFSMEGKALNTISNIDFKL